MRKNGLTVIVAGTGARAVLSVLVGWFLAAVVMERGELHFIKEVMERQAGGEPTGDVTVHAVYCSDRVAVLMDHHLQEEPETGTFWPPGSWSGRWNFWPRTDFR